ncbi:MAG: hypothetical protein A3H98_07305 [Bacteroidetes bacterium RIFCSPLOWO2_02_FULL_36_8]|nr:MAG: hypothetical protein A3H98_07305 [Bacteroidetes bacterium RIFCSPLOWO2_02_FULL_36_8]OFY69263.1 MAG: hypothetical protein A3G23_02225 [Bacteroidetes bacterium RIFCSPLOWO2_12_FULL_37_12]
MSTAQIRHQLYEYIRFAEEKKVKAIFTIVEDEIKEKQDFWDKTFTKEMLRRDNEIESGKVQGKNRKEVTDRALSLLKK